MSPCGDADLLVKARTVLLDALEALRQYQTAVVVIGAQAIYLHTGAAEVALPEATKDSDLALDTRVLPTDPRFEDAMTAAGFRQFGNPGNWQDHRGIPVDLMVPEALAGAAAKGRRGIRVEPFGKESARRAVGLEAAVIDHSLMPIPALAAGDDRVVSAKVAGPAALLVAKLHKIGERQGAGSRRLINDKDAHDAYRLLVATPTAHLAGQINQLRADELAGSVTEQALTYLREMFAAGPSALGSTMAGRAEQGVGDPATVAASVSFLAMDLLESTGNA
ncbi:MAG TPA: hypothetical protein VF317_04380 [Dermatophilaceae bacterium]